MNFFTFALFGLRVHDEKIFSVFFQGVVCEERLLKVVFLTIFPSSSFGVGFCINFED
jgi:hypothetical protein